MPLKLPPPADGTPDLLVIAGEHSGDQHAARMVRELLQDNPRLKIAAIGGVELEKAGAQLLFDLTRYSVVGFAEVLKNYGFFKNLFDEVVDWIRAHNPANVCFVDYPGFNLRLAKRLKEEGLSRKGGGAISTLYYIGPQVWAWKGHRRHAMAATLDALGVIFPFEVECFSDTDLPVEFVGHPFVTEADALPVAYDPDGPLLLLPGSRQQPVSRIFPLMAAAYARYRENGGSVPAAVLYPSESIRTTLERLKPASLGMAMLPVGAAAKGRAVLTSSGTISLACALAGLPGVIAYRAHPLTYHFAKRLVTIPYIGMPNLLLDAPHYPEFIQRDAHPAKLAAELQRLTTDPDAPVNAAQAAQQLRELLNPGAQHTPGKWLATHMA